MNPARTRGKNKHEINGSEKDCVDRHLRVSDIKIGLLLRKNIYLLESIIKKLSNVSTIPGTLYLQ